MSSRKLVISLGVLLFLIFVAIIGYYKFVQRVSNELKTSEPKLYALELAKSNQALQKIIGTDIYEDTLKPMIKGKSQMKLGVGADGINFGADAVDLEIAIKGELDSAKVAVSADKIEGKWIYHSLSAHIKSADTTIILKPKF
jgi:hypothetical protein